MNLRRFITDKRAVSPVIGVILMVAITVILAAVIGAFVLGIGGDQAVAPQVSFDVSETKNSTSGAANFTFRHDGGDTINSGDDDLFVQPVPGAGENYETNNNEGVTHERMSAGQTFLVSYDGTGDGIDSGDEITLIWSPDGGDDTNIIFVHTSTISNT